MRYILLMIFFLGVFQSLFAQQDKYREVSFGVKAGVTGSSLYGKDLSKLSVGGYVRPLPGIMVGITVHSRLSKYFGLHSEVTFNQSPVTIRLLDSSNGNIYNSRLSNTSLIIAPFTPTFYFHGLRLSAGPYVSGLLSSGLSDNKDIYGTPTSPGGFRYKIDAGVTMQLRYEWKNGMNIGAGYQRGFMPVIEDPRVQRQWKIYNQQFNVSVGYQWKRK